MANARFLRWGPNATYIPLARVGALHLGLTQILSFASGNKGGIAKRQPPTPGILRRSWI